MPLRLRPPRAEDEAAVLQAGRELADDGFEFVLDLAPGMSWSRWLELTEGRRTGRELPPGRVPATFLLADVDGEIVGRLSLRHELNEHLAYEGGHVGFGVRPAHRRRGYATEILAQGLVVARALGIERVMVTCEEGNRGSAGAIESCGGLLESVVTRRVGTRFRRYWID